MNIVRVNPSRIRKTEASSIRGAKKHTYAILEKRDTFTLKALVQCDKETRMRRSRSDLRNRMGGGVGGELRDRSKERADETL